MCCTPTRNMFKVNGTQRQRVVKGEEERNRQNMGDKTIHLIATFVFIFFRHFAYSPRPTPVLVISAKAILLLSIILYSMCTYSAVRVLLLFCSYLLKL